MIQICQKTVSKAKLCTSMFEREKYKKKIYEFMRFQRKKVENQCSNDGFSSKK